MIEFDTPESLAAFVGSTAARRIGVDGIDGVGKSTLAADLSRRLEFSCYSLDDFVEKNKGRYIPYVQVDKLKERLESQERFVIEGVCLLDAIEKAGESLDCLVYIKRFRHGLWADERECQIEGDVDEFIENERQTVALINGSGDVPDDLPFAEEVMRYHARKLPHKKATAIYRRYEC